MNDNVHMFVDVDGVLNVFGDPARYHDGTDSKAEDKYPIYNTKACYMADVLDEVYPRNKRYNIRWSHEMIHDLKTIIESPNVDFSWLTSWYPFTDEIINPLFDMSYEHNPDVNIDTVYGWMHLNRNYYDKYNYVRGYIVRHPDNPVIWIDDEYVNRYSYNDMKEALQTCRIPRRVLMIQTNSTIGISREQMDTIREFCAKPTQGIRFITEVEDHHDYGNHIGY